MNKNTINILKTILVLQILQFVVLISNEFKFSKIEKAITEYFAPLEDTELPSWEEERH